jgi:ERCC4-related helicase
MCVEIQKNLGEKISEKKVQELIDMKGVETIQKYLSKWDKFRSHTKSTQASHFIYAVENELQEPQTQQNKVHMTSNGRTPNYANFDQREWTEEELEKYYVTVESE